MFVKRVVINSSPIIVLFKSQQAELLPQLFSEIFIPTGVWDEVTTSSNNDVPARQLPTVDWVKKVTIKIAPEIATWDLGKGESEVLSFALQNTPDCVAIVDDRAARRCARSLGITTIGTGRVLILAKQRGLIPSVSPRIQALNLAAGVEKLDTLPNRTYRYLRFR